MASGIENDEELERLIREVTELFNRADVDAYLEYLDPDVELRPILAGSLEGESFKGHDGIRRYFEQRAEDIEEARIELEEVRRVAEDRVLSLGRWRVRGRGSGLEMEGPWGAVTVIRERKMLFLQGFGDHAEAERAAREAIGPESE